MKRIMDYLPKMATYLSFAMLILSVVLALFSWTVAAMYSNSLVRPILSGDGLRWIFGSFEENMCSRYLVWILFSGMAIGLLKESRMIVGIINFKKMSTYERTAVYIVLLEFVCITVAVFLLAFVKHAVLLSAIGTILPSSFSACIVPFSACSVCILSFTYGFAINRLASLDKTMEAISYGIYKISPLVVAYFVCREFFYMVVWIFRL